MTKQNDHGEWFNYVVNNVNYIAFCDLAFKIMMITVHDPTMEEYTYFDRIKRPGASLKLAVDAETANTANSINAAKFTCPVPSTNSTSSTKSALSTHPTSPMNSVLSTRPVPLTNSVLSTCLVLFTNSMFPVLSVFPTSFDNNSQQYIRKLYVLEHYNKEMGDSDNHVKLNSYYLVSRHYHRRN